MTDTRELCLAPYPKKLTAREGAFKLKGKRFIRLESTDLPQMLIPAAQQTGLTWELTASPAAPSNEVGLVIRLDENADIPEEGYKLSIKPTGIEITAVDSAGAFYGACTLKQILRQYPEEIPCLTINDSPDFAARGVMLDISRDKVPTMATLYHLVDVLSDLKINQLQLYTEHTFAYLAHPKVWKDASPMTGQEILELDDYCRSKFVELVPNQNSFGHMARWLKLDEYKSMAEAPNGCDTAWGHFGGPFSLCPTDKGSLPFLKGLFDELLPHFSSRNFNVGLDETIDLGCGRSRKICEEKGRGRVYLDFLLKIHELVSDHGRKMMFWGDIILHHPELITELPKDVIALEWGYEADHPFAEHAKQFAESGIEFHVCPGTSSWNTLVGRTDNAIDNIVSSAKHGLKHGSTGMLNTDWGDNGHWQPLSVSWLGYMVGAMTSWNAKAEVRKDLADNLSLHVFEDPEMKVGQAFYDLGNLYQCFEKRPGNQNVQWQMLFNAMGVPGVIEGVKKSELDDLESRTNEILANVKGEKMECPDARIVRQELSHLGDLMKLAALVGKVRLGEEKSIGLDSLTTTAKSAHDRVWMHRNRRGGMKDSLAKLVFTKPAPKSKDVVLS